MNARQVIEAETPKKTFRALPRQQWLNVGETVIQGTSDTRDIMRATLDRLAQLNPADHQAELTDEVEAYLRGREPEDFDPEYYLFEQLFNHMALYCLPFTYYGFLEADGSVGCWPVDRMSIEMAADSGKVDVQYAEENEEPNLNVRAPYVYWDNTQAGGGRDLWDTRTKKLVWSW